MKAVLPFSGAVERGSGSRAWPANLPGYSLKELTRSLKNQWKRCRKALRRCQDEFSEAAIHAYRVKTRRLLSGVEILDDVLSAQHREAAQHAFKQHLDGLDDLRDTQVQLQTVGQMLRQFPAARPFHTFLRKREKRLTRQTRQNFKQIRPRRLAQLIAACRDDVKARRDDLPPRRVAGLLLRSVERAFARTTRRRRLIRPQDAKTIHRTRLAFKKFRYMVEALADFLPGVTDDHLAELRHYQTLMGEIQDAEVLLRTLDKFLRQQELKPEAARRFREELQRRRQWMIRVYLDEADDLLGFWPLPNSRAGVLPAKAGQTLTHKAHNV